jgi:mannosylglucosylglycerate synthase
LMADAGHEVQMVAGRGEPMEERVALIQIPLVDSRHPVVSAMKQQLDQGIVPDDFHQVVEELAVGLQAVLSKQERVIAHNVCSLNKNLVLTAALKRLSEELHGSRFILWHHDLAWTTPRYRNELYDGYPWNLLCEAWEGVAQVTISEFRRRELADLMGLSEEKIHLIPNGVEIPRFLKWHETTLHFVNELDLLAASPLLLLPVRITSRKNIELALEVMGQLRKKAPLAKLIITGPLGPHNPANMQYFERLKSLQHSLGLDDAVHFLAEFSNEYLPDDVVSDFYHFADALLLPSREEGFGIPMLEAALSGIPIFCADIPPLRDLGKSFVDYFSPDENPANIASTIFNNLSTSRLFEFRVQVRSQYAWQQIYQQQIGPLLERVSENEQV